MTGNNIVRYRLLDALRGLAILWIVCFHMLSGVRENYGSILKEIISYGYLGVSIFFVISGYSIASTIFSNHRYSLQPCFFLIRRFKRIYFCYWWHLLFAALIFPVLTALVYMMKTHTFTIEFFNYSSFEWLQIATLSKVFTSTSWKLNRSFSPINEVVWYIAIIVQIYLFVSFCMLFKKKLKLLLFLGFIASVLTYIPGVKTHIPFGLFLPYFCQFYIGISVFHILNFTSISKYKKIQIITLSILVFFLSICYLTKSSFLDLNFALVTGITIFFLFDYDFTLNRFFIIRIFGFIGEFSYSLYLLHVPLSPFFDMFVRNIVPISKKFSIPLILIPGVTILSFIWYLFFEKPHNQSDVIKSIASPIKTLKSGVSFIHENLNFYRNSGIKIG